MRKGNIFSGILLCFCLCLMGGTCAFAAFDLRTEQDYNTAVQAEDAQNGLEVAVREQTVSAQTNLASKKQVQLKMTGLKEDNLLADILVKSEEGSAQSYYQKGLYYETAADVTVCTEMGRDVMWNRINSHIYLDMTSNYLTMLYSQPGSDGSTVYTFAANDETLGDYKVKLLDEYSLQHGAKIEYLEGTMTVDAQGHVSARSISMVYSVGQDAETTETFHKSAQAVFSQDGDVKVTIPDLSAYKPAEAEKPPITIQELRRTVYTTADVNVRAAGSLDAAVIGGYPRGSGVSQTGITSDGWVQIQYNQETGYIWSEYISAVKPVYVTDSSGIMYATADVNIRDHYSTDGKILGILKKGQGIDITGVTDNGWTRVAYAGTKGYISSNFLSRSEPVADTYVRDAVVQGTILEASYGSLTVQTWDGRVMFFNTQYAVMELADYLETGDAVTVIYSGSASPYTATSVVDQYTHYSFENTMQYYSMDGIVTDYHGNTLEMACSDGINRSFDLSQAHIEVPALIRPGDYLTATWLSESGVETSNILTYALS